MKNARACRSIVRIVFVAAVMAAAQTPALAWNARGHATVTYLAMDGLGDEAPAWLRSERARRRIAYAASEADRWRGTNIPQLIHENAPDHYLDIELLDQFGLKLRTLPRFRYAYVAAMAEARQEHPDRVESYDPESDPSRSHEWPGFLPYSIMERYAKVRSSLHTVRVLERLENPRRRRQLDQARAHAMFQMGMLSHFVADAAQPLHTTRHYNGWKGPNPSGFTRSDEFHAHIDGGVLAHHDIDHKSLHTLVRPPLRIDNPKQPWETTLDLIERSFEQVVPLYELKKSGELKEQAGEAFIADRLLDAGLTLAGLYRAAWRHAEPTEKDVESFVKYNPASFFAEDVESAEDD